MAVWRCVLLEERPVEEVHLSAVDLRASGGRRKCGQRTLASRLACHLVVSCLVSRAILWWCACLRVSERPAGRTWMAPPLTAALLPVILERSIRSVELPLTRIAPPDCARLPWRVLSSRVTFEWPSSCVCGPGAKCVRWRKCIKGASEKCVPRHSPGVCVRFCERVVPAAPPRFHRQCCRTNYSAPAVRSSPGSRGSRPQTAHDSPGDCLQQ